MKLKIHFLFLIFFHSFLSCITTQEESIFNGFQHFLDNIYSYERKKLVGGLSKNTQYLYTVNDKKYVVRVLGEILSKRQSEVGIHSLAATHGIAPHVYYYDDAYSFIIMDYIEGHTLSLEQANKPEVLDCTAKKVHLITPLDAHAFINEDGWNLFAQINKDYNKIKNQQDAILNAMIEQTFSTTQSIHQFLENQQHPLVFCHNDLNYRNIFFTEKDVIFIDWEMAGMNYELYDLAYYSVFSCLQEANDTYLLTKYLERTPFQADLNYFKYLKLMIRCCNVFYILAFLDNIPTHIPMESIKDFKFYAQIFCEDPTVISPEFLYAIAISQFRMFFEEYSNMMI